MKPLTPLLRVDTESLTPPSHVKSGYDGSPGGSNTSASLTPSPSFYIPLSPSVDKYSPSAQLARMALSQRDSANHAREESKKLVGLLLDQLSSRTRPPPIFDALNVHATSLTEAGLGNIIGAVRNVVKQKSHKRSQSMKEDSDDEGSAHIIFSSETTFDLMVQLKDVLLFSASQGWQVFDQGYEIIVPVLAESTLKTNIELLDWIQMLNNSSNHYHSPFAALGEEVALAEGAQDLVRLRQRDICKLLR
jgi:hypothetical protein